MAPRTHRAAPRALSQGALCSAEHIHLLRVAAGGTQDTALVQAPGQDERPVQSDWAVHIASRQHTQQLPAPSVAESPVLTTNSPPCAPPRPPESGRQPPPRCAAGQGPRSPRQASKSSERALPRHAPRALRLPSAHARSPAARVQSHLDVVRGHRAVHDLGHPACGTGSTAVSIAQPRLRGGNATRACCAATRPRRRRSYLAMSLDYLFWGEDLIKRSSQPPPQKRLTNDVE